MMIDDNTCLTGPHCDDAIDELLAVQEGLRGAHFLVGEQTSYHTGRTRNQLLHVYLLFLINIYAFN